MLASFFCHQKGGVIVQSVELDLQEIERCLPTWYRYAVSWASYSQHCL